MGGPVLDGLVMMGDGNGCGDCANGSNCGENVLPLGGRVGINEAGNRVIGTPIGLVPLV